MSPRTSLPVFATVAAGVLVLLLGVSGLAGYLLHVAPLVQFPQQDAAPVAPASFALMVIAGAALMSVGFRPQETRLSTMLAVLIVLLAGTHLVETVFGLPGVLDFPELEAWLPRPGMDPGRLGPLSSLAFAAFGIALGLAPRAQSRRQALTVVVLTVVAGAAGLFGLIGNILSLDFLYTWHGYPRMPLHNGIALLAAGCGLYWIWHHQPAFLRARPRTDAEQLVVMVVVAVAVVTALAGLAAFKVMQDRLEALVGGELRERVADRATYIGAELSAFEARANLVADTPAVTALCARLLQNPGDTAAARELELMAAKFLPAGFGAIRFAAPNGTVWATLGEFQSHPALALPIKSHPGLVLLWSDGFFLRSERSLFQNGVPVGTLTSEQPADTLTRLSAAAGAWGESGEILLCGPGTPGPSCAPTRFYPHPFHMTPMEPPLPMQRALSGEAGVTKLNDFRNHPALAAFRPVADTGLGLVVKIDLDEIYAPIRHGFEVLLPLLLALILAAALIVRHRVNPLFAHIQAAQELAARSANQLREAVEGSGEAIYILEALRDDVGTIEDFTVRYVNEAGVRLTGLEREQLVDHTLSQAMPALWRSNWFDRFRRVLATGRVNDTEYALAVAGQGERWVQQRIVPIHGGIAISVRDIGERHELEEQLRHMPQNDPLTGLPNRALCLDRLERAMLRTGRRRSLLALLVTDIDGFAGINATYGHAVGDTILRTFAERLARSVRAEDTVARIGPDRFAAVLEAVGNRIEAFKTAESILEGLKREIELTETTLSVNVSIGLALYSGEAMTPAALLQHGEVALAEVKRSGRGGYYAAEFPDRDRPPPASSS